MNVKEVKKPSKSYEVPTTFTSFMIQKRGVVNMLKSSNGIFLEQKSYAKQTMADQDPEEKQQEVQFKYSRISNKRVGWKKRPGGKKLPIFGIF